MAEVLLRFETPLRTNDGTTYIAQACGRPIENGRRWEGWIEFLDVESGTAVRTGQETVQPNRETTLYWATGITVPYLEGALERALAPATTRRPEAPGAPTFPGPAPRPPSSAGVGGVRAILDPFEVRLQGEEVLRDELLALDTMHLRNIALAYGLADHDAVRDARLGRAALADLIITGVEKRVEGRAAPPPE